MGIGMGRGIRDEAEGNRMPSTGYRFKAPLMQADCANVVIETDARTPLFNWEVAPLPRSFPICGQGISTQSVAVSPCLALTASPRGTGITASDQQHFLPVSPSSPTRFSTRPVSNQIKRTLSAPSLLISVSLFPIAFPSCSLRPIPACWDVRCATRV